MVCYSQDTEVNKVFNNKPALDTRSFSNWEWVGKPVISNDGKYISFITFYGSSKNKVLTVKSIDGKWKLNINGGERVTFSNDNKRAIFIANSDTIYIIKLGTYEMKTIPNVKMVKIFNNETECIIYGLGLNNTLSIYNISNGKINSFNQVIDYYVSKSGKTIYVKKIYPDYISLAFINIVQGVEKEIWQGSNITHLSVDKSSDAQIIFLGRQKSKMSMDLFYFKPGEPFARVIEDRSNIILKEGLYIDNIIGFSQDNKNAYLSLKKKHKKLITHILI